MKWFLSLSFLLFILQGFDCQSCIQKKKYCENKWFKSYKVDRYDKEYDCSKKCDMEESCTYWTFSTFRTKIRDPRSRKIKIIRQSYCNLYKYCNLKKTEDSTGHQRNINSTSGPKGCPHTENCPKEWTYYHNTAKCYKFYKEYTKWTDAHSFCTKIYPLLSSNFASIHDSHQNSFVRQFAKPFAWIGGFRIHPTHTDKSAFAWTDGSKFNYVAGNDVHLKNHFGDQLCLVINTWSKTGSWSTDNCEYKRPFICQTNSLRNNFNQ